MPEISQQEAYILVVIQNRIRAREVKFDHFKASFYIDNNYNTLLKHAQDILINHPI